MRRKWADLPIQDIEAFAIAWSAWWVALQPTERLRPHGRLRPPSYDADWTCLRKPGANGIQLLLVTLRWWGKASNASPAWRMAVADFAATLRCVTDSVPGMHPQIDGIVPVATATATASRLKRKKSIEPDPEVKGKRVRVQRFRSH